MRARAVGGLEPDEAEQRELVQLWHLSRTGLSRPLFSAPLSQPGCGYVPPPDRAERIAWVVDMFLREHPNVGRKWVYVWCEAELGRLAGAA